MKEIKYNIPVYEDEDIADLKEYSEKMAEAIKAQIDKFGNPLIFKGILETLEELQAITDAVNGEIYAVAQENKNYIWNGTVWEIYSNISNYINTASDIVVSSTEPVANRKKVWIKKGKNLFNDHIEGYGLEENGNVFTSIHRAISNFIPVEQNLSYCISGAEIRMANFYDKDKKFISGLNVLEMPVFVTPANACYIRVSFENTSDFETFQIEQGTEATEYEAYVEPNVYILNKNGDYEKFIKKEERNIITASLANNNMLGTKNVEKLDLMQKTKVGGLFEISDGGIKIGTGIAHIKIAGQICYSSETVNGDTLGLYIYKNNATIEIVEEKAAGGATLSLSEYLVDVQEGDIIYLYARDRTTVGATVTTHSFLTVEAV